MKSNFYEKLIKNEDKNKKIKIEKMSKLLDESINECINLRERQTKERILKPAEEIKLKFKEIINLSRREELNNNNFFNSSRRNERIQRIRNMINLLEEETENLNRLIENNNTIETVG